LRKILGLIGEFQMQIVKTYFEEDTGEIGEFWEGGGGKSDAIVNETYCIRRTASNLS
jgi:hypothetical protein